MPALVTIALPVYKRLDYLPQALHAVQVQDHPDIELIVSDNGMNGEKIIDIVKTAYSRPYRFRQNATSVAVIAHFNQLINEASGEYFVLLSDDDEISPNYISELVNILESDPQVSMAFSRQEVTDEDGHIQACSKANIPPVMSGNDFIRAWCLYRLGLKCLVTQMSRTRDLRMCGGFPEFSLGIHSDNALPLKLCLSRRVAFSQRCTFRYRVHRSSLGFSANYQDVAKASRQFLTFLDSDPTILAFASAQPEQWARLKRYVIKLTWQTYLSRWKRGYRETLPPMQWIRAAFVMPYIPAYYRAVISTLAITSRSAVCVQAKERLPWMYKIYQGLK